LTGDESAKKNEILIRERANCQCSWGGREQGEGVVVTEAPFQSAEPEFQAKLWVSDDHHNDFCCHFALHGKAYKASAAELKLVLS